MIVSSVLLVSPLISLLCVILLANISDFVLDFNKKASSAVFFNYLIFLECGEGHDPFQNLLKDVQIKANVNPHPDSESLSFQNSPSPHRLPRTTKVHETSLGILSLGFYLLEEC